MFARISSSIRYAWIALLAVQIICIVGFVDLSPHDHGIVNRDAFSYFLQWNRVSETLNPFSEPVLKDPGHDLVRIPFSFPHFVMGVTATVLTPLQTYLLWSCLGVLTSYFSLLLLARSFGFRDTNAHALALVHYTIFHWLSQFPPLSSAQFSYLTHAWALDSETLLHFGPRQYPHDIFFYPLLVTLVALTIWGVKKMKRGGTISTKMLWLWVCFCALLPFNYLYHWFQYATMLGLVIVVGFGLRWWTFSDLIRRHKTLLWSIVLVGGVWISVIVIQNAQLADEEGYRFALMGGLTEHRFFLLPAGLLLRILLWSVALLIVLRITPNSIVLVTFLVGCALLLNLQIITGKTIQPGHWAFGVDRIFAWMILLIGASLLNRYFERSKSKIVFISCCLVIALSVAQTFVSWRSFERISRWDPERAQLVEYLNTQPKGVVLVPEIWLETDILIHTKHYNFLPRGAQSAVSQREQMERLTHAALMLGYSEQGFMDWLQIRSVRFFGLLYGTEKEFSSSLYYDKTTQPEVIDFTEKHILPSWDKAQISRYMTSDDFLTKQLDWIVLFADEETPSVKGEVVFQNDRYRVVKVQALGRKVWGQNLPIKEQRYPLIRIE